MGPSPVGDGKQAAAGGHLKSRGASMGPSPVGDGKAVRDRGDLLFLHVLQWGRRLLATERVIDELSDAQKAEASMGPSPVGDGKDQCFVGIQSAFRASMGPSPVGDGKLQW